MSYLSTQRLIMYKLLLNNFFQFYHLQSIPKYSTSEQNSPMDLEILQSLLKFQKKKHIKKLFEHCLAINYHQQLINPHFSTPIIDHLQQEIGLSGAQIHKLILAITGLLKVATYVNFEQERLHLILSEKVQEQLQTVIIQILISLEEQIKEIQVNRVRQGKQLDVDLMDWSFETQISNQKGKSNVPVIEILLPLQEGNEGESSNVKFEMKGQQFQVFFSNLTKIKQTLNELIAEG